MPTAQEIKDLYQRYLANDLSAEELNNFLQALHLPAHEQQVSNLMDDTWKQMFDKVAEEEQQAQAPAMVRVLTNHKRTIIRIAVAASLLITIGILYFVISTKEKSPPAVVGVPTNHDVPAPDKNRAQIKLSDGTIVYLDSAGNGELVKQGNVVVTKTADGKIVYSGSGSSPEGEAGVRFNTLSNPRGSKVQPLTLSDGTKLWLNAESSITYPTAFTGNQRKVSITGEAYFEIAKHDLPPALAAGKKGVRMPFIVSANNKADVTVLGTHFNVNAYDDENDIKVTLLEGSVKVSNSSSPQGEAGVRLKPGQQAILSLSKETQNSELRTLSPDLEKTMAWKNNDFIFQDDDLESIMRQLARWYNINPIFTNQSASSNSTNYTGRITRTVPISEVLAMFEKLGYVKFQINGNDVKIIPVR